MRIHITFIIYNRYLQKIITQTRNQKKKQNEKSKDEVRSNFDKDFDGHYILGDNAVSVFILDYKNKLLLFLKHLASCNTYVLKFYLKLPIPFA